MLRRDCRHFPGDRPCTFHKQDLIDCDACTHYAPRGTSILIVKLEALGDVLRTTSILPALHRHYQPCHITWIASEGARDLFIGNSMVDRVVWEPEARLATLLSRTFDVVINPDTAPFSCELATLARGDQAFGFRLGPGGVVVGLNEAADHWLEMGGSDVLKRTNTKTYQHILHDMCDLDPQGQHIVLGLTAEEAAAREDIAGETGIDPTRPVIGLNTGAGRRWRLKKWRTRGFMELIDMILEWPDAQVVLLGGELERSRNALIKSRFGRRVRDPFLRDLRQFVRTVDLCDVVVTGDTLALHAALGLKRRVIALFGPTSPAEIEMYGLGTKVVPDMDCVCCYKTECDREPNCMDAITAEEVFGYLEKEMRIAAQGREEEVTAGADGILREPDECMVGEPTADW